MTRVVVCHAVQRDSIIFIFIIIVVIFSSEYIF